VIGFFDCCRVKAISESKGEGIKLSSYNGRYVIVYNAMKGGKAMINDKFNDKLSKGTSILLNLLKDYNSSKIDLFSFFKNEVPKVTFGNVEANDKNINSLCL
jgi:hypothetical protein